MNRLFVLPPLLLPIMIVGCSPPKQEAPAGSTGDMNMAMPMAGDSAATRGYKTSMSTMMAKMPQYTGDPDVDFMQQMRGHHQAAIDMATVELANGKDPEARALATSIIAAQKAEIAQMGKWLEKKPN
ncbi:MAG: DUF305 domain-containing protein [Sphingomonas sp.]|jgi:uncharacterized protein (DUF305 family)|uniref:CopM family metallochaperone n=1 Tax=Sphingomonas sp. TaxID=28214 RepID=UPI0035664BC9